MRQKRNGTPKRHEQIAQRECPALHGTTILAGDEDEDGQDGMTSREGVKSLSDIYIYIIYNMPFNIAELPDGMPHNLCRDRFPFARSV